MADTNAKVRSGTEIRMIKTRTDGTQVDLGIVSAEYDNPVRQLWWVLVGRPRANARIRAENRRAVKAYREEVNGPHGDAEDDA